MSDFDTLKSMEMALDLQIGSRCSVHPNTLNRWMADVLEMLGTIEKQSAEVSRLEGLVYSDDDKRLLSDCRDMQTRLGKQRDQIESLRSACQKMLDCTGGSKHWNGETHNALIAIEAAMDTPSGSPKSCD